MSLALGICGCGVMGRRHVLGLKKLRDVGRLEFELVGAIDPVRDSGERLAGLAEELLGRRPQVFGSLSDLRNATALDALVVTTSPDSHADVAVEAFQAGLHVLVEKPIALTVRQGARMVRAAAEAQCVFAVGENYRRDPINRLARAMIDAGTIERPFLAIQSSAGSGQQVIITPWRHRRRSCGILVDMGVHYTDLLEYYLGAIDRLVGMSSIVDSERTDEHGVRHPADAEDLTVGVARFANGAIANLVLNLAGRGDGHFSRLIYGTGGSLSMPGDRSGKPIALVQRRDGQDVPVLEAEQLTLVPGFALDATTAALFGGERLTSYKMAWADIDASLLAIEFDDFTGAILSGRQPEVSGRDGLRSLAVIYGFLESERLGRVVDVDELLSGKLALYQGELEAVGQEMRA